MDHLDISSGVDLMNAVSWGSTGLTVQIETLDKHRVVAKATHPNIPLSPTLQLNSPTNVKPAGKQRAEEESQRRDKEEGGAWSFKPPPVLLLV